MATIWITGASSGIGRALALARARRGDTVLATARNAEALQSLADEARSLRGTIRIEPGDVTDRAAMAAIVASAEATAGPIDIAVLNAGIALAGQGEAFDAGAFAKTFDVNVMGAVHGLAAVLPGMVARRRGRVAIMGSLAGYGGLPASAAYGASKAALINMAASLRMDLEPAGVVVQVINPGFVATPGNLRRGRLPFLVPIEQAADLIVAGLSSNRFEIAFPRRFALLLKAINMLPYPLYFALVGRMAGGATRRTPKLD